MTFYFKMDAYKVYKSNIYKCEQFRLALGQNRSVLT